tara:strand:+ start:310 stop:822 length:513 start_codon:yes stop_codon:yes gene_type:complete
VTTDLEHLIFIKNRLLLTDISASGSTDYIIRLNSIINKMAVNEQFVDPYDHVASIKPYSVKTKPLSKIASDYESLSKVLEAAYKQASEGKGKERHASNGLSFLDQPMQTISKLLNTSDGLSFQVCKKVTESKSMETLAQKERELLGAIVYVAGIIIYEKNKASEKSKKII